MALLVPPTRTCDRDMLLRDCRRSSAYVSRTAPQWRHRCIFMMVVAPTTERTRALSTPIYRSVHACMHACTWGGVGVGGGCGGGGG